MQRTLTIAVAAIVLLTSCGGGGDGGTGGDATGSTGGGTCMASGLSDAGVHAPPASGSFPYSPPGNWLPGQVGFPARGDSFLDPVFGTTLRRITDERPEQSFSDIYAANGWWNADASLFVHRTSTDWIAIDATNGTEFRPGMPGGTGSGEISFDPVDPDIWYYYQNDELWRLNVRTGDAMLVKDFNFAVDNSLGGSVDWIDRSGRYFLVASGGALQVWDRVEDRLYLNSIPFDVQVSGGWAGISPDGNFVITATGEFTSYPIDHKHQTLSTSGTMFWNLCGDHGDLISASDGRTYLVAFECNNQGAVYRVDVTISHTGAGVDQQQAANKMLIDTDIFWDSGHFSCVSSGPNRDWCFVSIESGDDDSLSQGPWWPYKQEIVAVQVVPPFGVRRLAHHRSRSLTCPFPQCDHSGYYRTPRLSVSWDGRRVAFASNFGVRADPVEYADIYVLDLSCPP